MAILSVLSQTFQNGMFLSKYIFDTFYIFAILGKFYVQVGECWRVGQSAIGGLTHQREIAIWLSIYRWMRLLTMSVLTRNSLNVKIPKAFTKRQNVKMAKTLDSRNLFCVPRGARRENRCILVENK